MVVMLSLVNLVVFLIFCRESLAISCIKPPDDNNVSSYEGLQLDRSWTVLTDYQHKLLFEGSVYASGGDVLYAHGHLLWC